MSIRDLTYKFYWKIENKIVPGLRSSQYPYQEAVSAAMLPAERVLTHPAFARWRSNIVATLEKR